MPLPASLEVYECANADACVGGSDVASYCADGFKGPRKFMLSAAVDVLFFLSSQLYMDTECMHTLILDSGHYLLLPAAYYGACPSAENTALLLWSLSARDYI